MKKRILHLIATNFYGGPEKQIIEHLLRLNLSNEFQGILCSFIEGKNRNEILEVASQRGVPNFHIIMKNQMDLRALFQIVRVLRKNKIDIIVAHHYKAVILGTVAARLLGIRILDYSRGFTAENKKIVLYEKLERFFLRFTDGIISVAEGQKKRLQNYGIQNKPMWVVHNGVETPKNHLPLNSTKQKLYQELNIPEDKLLAVSVGRLSPEKGHRYLIESIARLSSSLLKRICFIFCGEGVCKETLIKQAQTLGIFKNCRFVGFREDMDKVYTTIDLLILPSLTEGLPNVVLEAFSFKKPVIATSVGGVPEIIENNRNGYIVPPKNPFLLAESINKMVSDSKNRKMMGEEGYAKVKNKFTFESQTKKLIDIYNTILNS